MMHMCLCIFSKHCVCACGGGVSEKKIFFFNFVCVFVKITGKFFRSG